MAAQPKQQRSSILLVDDKKRTALDIGRRLEKLGFICQVTSDPDEVLKLVSNNNLDLILIDINMQPVNGVTLTRMIKDINPNIPVAAFTGVLNVRPWSNELREAGDMFVDIIEKPFPVGDKDIQDFCQRLIDIVNESKYRSARKRGHSSIVESSIVEDPPDIFVIDPFEISFENFLALDAQVAQRLRMRAWEMKEEWFLQQVEESNLDWVVVCGDVVVRTSVEGGPIPAREELLDYGIEYDRIPFLFVRPPIVEESAWTRTVRKQFSGANDYYPTIKCTVEWGSNSHNLTGDFDTGSIASCIDSNIVPIDPFYDPLMGGIHLNQSYVYSVKQLKILLNDEKHNVHSAFLDVYVIKNWSASPFILVNPKRQMLVGRDILQVFSLRFTLDATQRKSFIEP